MWTEKKMIINKKTNSLHRRTAIFMGFPISHPNRCTQRCNWENYRYKIPSLSRIFQPNDDYHSLVSYPRIESIFVSAQLRYFVPTFILVSYFPIATHCLNRSMFHFVNSIWYCRSSIDSYNETGIHNVVVDVIVALVVFMMTFFRFCFRWYFE